MNVFIKMNKINWMILSDEIEKIDKNYNNVTLIKKIEVINKGFYFVFRVVMDSVYSETLAVNGYIRKNNAWYKSV